MTWRPGLHVVALGALVATATACVPVTVNISFPQEKLDTAAKQIEDITAQTPAPSAPAATAPAATAPAATAPAATAPAATTPAGTSPSATSPPATSPAPPPQPSATVQGRTVDVTPRIDARSPEVLKATASRRERRAALREWKTRGCLGETNQGLLEARTGEGCTAEAVEVMRGENADRLVIYQAFMKDNNIPESDTPRVRSAFAKARQERARSGDWIQLDDGKWVKRE
jgi:uncharacterized protein YdbL (DUF1318 family)